MFNNSNNREHHLINSCAMPDNLIRNDYCLSFVLTITIQRANTNN